MICGLPYIPVTDPTYAEAVKPGTTVSMSGDDYTQISSLFYKPLDADGKIEVDGVKMDWANQYSNATTVARVGPTSEPDEPATKGSSGIRFGAQKSKQTSH